MCILNTFLVSKIRSKQSTNFKMKALLPTAMLFAEVTNCKIYVFYMAKKVRTMTFFVNKNG